MKLVILLKLHIICVQSHLSWLCGKLAICEKNTNCGADFGFGVNIYFFRFFLMKFISFLCFLGCILGVSVAHICYHLFF